MRTPGFEAMQNYSLTPLVRRRAFRPLATGRCDTPKPADDLPYMQAMWNYAQGMAAARQGRIDDAKRFHEALVPATTNPDDREDDGLGSLLADRRRADRRALRGRRNRARRRRTTTARSRRSTPRSRSRTRCSTTSHRPGIGRRARRSARCCSQAGKPAEAEQAYPRRAAAQSGERLVAQRPRAGPEGAGQEGGSAGSADRFAQRLGERGHRPRQDLRHFRRGRSPLKGTFTFAATWQRERPLLAAGDSAREVGGERFARRAAAWK